MLPRKIDTRCRRLALDPTFRQRWRGAIDVTVLANIRTNLCFPNGGRCASIWLFCVLNSALFGSAAKGTDSDRRRCGTTRPNNSSAFPSRVDGGVDHAGNYCRPAVEAGRRSPKFDWIGATQNTNRGRRMWTLARSRERVSLRENDSRPLAPTQIAKRWRCPAPLANSAQRQSMFQILSLDHSPRIQAFSTRFPSDGRASSPELHAEKAEPAAGPGAAVHAASGQRNTAAQA